MKAFAVQIPQYEGPLDILLSIGLNRYAVFR